MYLSRAATLAQNAAKLSRSTAESLRDSAQNLTIDATSSSRFFDTSEDKIKDIARQLDSRHDREKLESLKRLVAMISKGRDVSEFFAQVVKNVASHNLEVRKLVYIYLLRYAEQEPDLALLSINTFQKDLTDQNPLIRAMALRVMSGIRVPVIGSIVLLGIKKCSADPSPYVRKTAALAIPKCYGLDSTQRESLIEIISCLMADTSTFVIGSVITAFTQVCPDRLDLIHPQFRKLCKMLPDVDEWGQIEIMNLLLRYAHTQFVDPTNKSLRRAAASGKPTKASSSHFYSDDEDNDDPSQRPKDSQETAFIDPDHELMLTSAKPLFQSRNSAVVMAAARLYFYAAPDSEKEQISRPLLKLIRSPPEMQFVVLTSIATIVRTMPALFMPYFTQFYIYPSDPQPTKLLKVEILSSIVSDTTITDLLREIREYVKSPDHKFVAAAIQAIGKCAARLPQLLDTCLSALMKLLWIKSDVVVAESVVVIRRLLQRRSTIDMPAIMQLIRVLEHVTVPMARASILYLVGQNAKELAQIAPDVLRVAVKTFANEDDAVKLQIINLAAKLLVLNPEHHTILLLFQYVMTLARYDLSYDIRDRARYLKGLVGLYDKNGNVKDGASANLTLGGRVEEILFSQKGIALPEEPKNTFTLGSLSMALSHVITGYEALPPWASEPSNPILREPKEAPRQVNVSRGFGNEDVGYRSSPVTSSAARMPAYSDNVDAFYDEEEEDDDDDDDDEEESSEEETDEEETDEEEDSEEDDEEDGEDDESEEEELEETSKLV